LFGVAAKPAEVPSIKTKARLIISSFVIFIDGTVSRALDADILRFSEF
jgi:hypothetical protein